ncbi:type II secretion system protein [Candidatus Saccharibacteria bacterium]|nr:type II secretion system protein [Candidatus Saccharibacteria bacterium]
MNVLRNNKAQKGFTIIEVVLVLAIAGLIFLMVFIALPALQRNQRDTQRKGDMGRLQTALINYTNSNRGKLPTNYPSFSTQYLVAGGDSFIDPTGATTAQGTAVTTYVLTLKDNSALATDFATSQNIIYYTPSYVCADTSSDVKAGGTRKVAFRMVLESGGFYCVNN